jgi:hypothetical protein
MRCLAVSVIVLTWTIMCPAGAALAVENTTLVLHAQPVEFECQGSVLPFDCTEGSGPTVTVTSGQLWFIYIFVRNYEEAGIVTCRMAVNGGSGVGTWGDWEVLGSSFGCLPGQIASEVPVQSVPEREPGNITTAFNCLTGGALQPLGWVLFRVGSSGCLGIEEHEWGTGVVDCHSTFHPVPGHNRGRICIGAVGHDACEPGQVPVESSTWGRIKEQYR